MSLIFAAAVNWKFELWMSNLSVKQPRKLGHWVLTLAGFSTSRTAKLEEAEVFMGAIVQSPTDNVEIPFFGKGLPIEYELTRSVRTVSQKDRLTIGVLQTDANVISSGGGMGGGGRDWAIVSELRKQYKVIGVNPSRKILAGEGDCRRSLMMQSKTLTFCWR